MSASRWTMRCARMLAVELHSIACEDLAVQLDGGLAGAAVAAISAVPAGPRRDMELALWTRRIAAGPMMLALVVDENFGENEIEILARLHVAVNHELATGGGS